jgi:cyclohexanone monooxygenase
MNDFGKASLDGLELDVAVIGSGFAGIYSLHKLRNDLNLNVQSFDDAGDLGGTWYWNRYPGVRVDTEVTAYCYKFDEEFSSNWNWTERYPRQPEILEYLHGIADKYDLKRSMNFNSKIVKAEWSEATSRWSLTTAKGEHISAQFVIEGVGLLSSVNRAHFKGDETFKGEILHTARWPQEGFDLKGKRVGIIGTGSSGIQVIADIAKDVDHLFVLQRTPQYVVPAQHSPITPELKKWMAEDYDGYWKWVMNSATAFGIQESDVPAMSVSKEERQRVYEESWSKGGGFRFMLGTFGDIITSRESNNTATDFIRGKIAEIVKNPETAALLMPHDLYAKRPLCADDYYETFNRDNVTLVDVKKHPIIEITPNGILTKAGEIELDVIIMATGFDAVTGNYLKIETVGRDGMQLKDHWKDGPKSVFGLNIANFPNLFMVFGPFSPFTNQPPVHEYQIEWIVDAIKHVRESGKNSIEADVAAEQKWVDDCDAVAAQTLFAETDSWINGSNVAGKPRTNMFYMGGMAAYSIDMERMTAADYEGFNVK